VDEQFSLLPVDFEYKDIFRDVITNKLQLPLANLEKCFNDFKAAALLDYTLPELDNDAPIDIVSNENFARAALSSEWQAAVPDISITLPAAATARDTIVYIINHNLFNAQVEGLLNGISSVVNRANDLFEQTLADYPQHSPHYALFLAFVQLYRHTQDETEPLYPAPPRFLLQGSAATGQQGARTRFGSPAAGIAETGE